MNREIKFQFVIDDKKISRAYSLDEIINISEESIVENMETCDCQLNESNNHCEGACTKYENSKITTKRQYTGLTDKNGKEIYEGDVVRWDYTHFNGISRVVFYDGAFHISDYPFKDHTQIQTGERIEVVGNMYETPELLK